MSNNRPVTADRVVDADNIADALSISQFCRRHGLSESFFFKLRAQGRGPRTMQLGRRVLISQESARAWRQQHERRTAKRSEPANTQTT